MSSIAEAVDDLIARPKPVLCLDTCDFLDVVRCFADSNSKEANVYHARSFRRALHELNTRPDRFQVVITYLVRHEWNQNIAEARDKANNHLLEIDHRLDQIAEACGLGKTLPPIVSPRLKDLSLARGLIDLAEALMNQAVVLEKESVCLERALERVMERRRPSHKKEIKDSIHWEHYLEFSRRLASAGHIHERVFVSANKADYWADRNTANIHPELEDEARAAGLKFFGRMDLGLRALGI